MTDGLLISPSQKSLISHSSSRVVLPIHTTALLFLACMNAIHSMSDAMLMLMPLLICQPQTAEKLKYSFVFCTPGSEFLDRQSYQPQGLQHPHVVPARSADRWAARRSSSMHPRKKQPSWSTSLKCWAAGIESRGTSPMTSCHGWRQ
jgi:hypothetical protein